MVVPGILMMIAYAWWLLVLAVALSHKNDASRIKALEVARRRRVEDIWG